MHKIIFSGKIVPGHDPAKVREKLLSMLGLESEQADRLFCGKPRVLKKNLSAQEAEHYRDHLSKRGVAVDIVPSLKPHEPIPPFPELIYDFDGAPEEEVVAAPQPVASARLAPMPPPRSKDSAAKPVSRPAFKAPSRPWVKSGE